MCCVYLGRMDAAFLYPRNLIQFTDDLQAKDPLGNIDEIDYLVSETVLHNPLPYRRYCHHASTLPAFVLASVLACLNACPAVAIDCCR